VKQITIKKQKIDAKNSILMQTIQKMQKVKCEAEKLNKRQRRSRKLKQKTHFLIK
jgi:hypothetical protein